MSLRPKRVNFEAIYTVFEEVLTNMYDFANVKISGIDMFQQVYDMCTAHPRPYTEQLFASLGRFLSDRCAGCAASILLHDDIVTAYAAEWEKYRIASSYINIICQYLNRMLVKMKNPHSNSNNLAGDSRYRKMSIEALAFAIWKDRVLHEINFIHANRLIYQLLEMISKDRDGQTISNDVVRKAINSYVELNQHTDQPLQGYIEEFEKPYIANVREYYMKESNQLIASVSISEYMIKANQRLTEEAARSARFLDITSHEKVIKECEAQYLTAHQQPIHTDFEDMIARERTDDCNLAYSLLSRIPDGVVPLLEIYEKFIANKGGDLVVRAGSTVLKDPREFVEALMALQKKCIDFCNKVFAGDAAFIAAVDKAFTTIINSDSGNSSTNCPEVLARYCDLMLKKGTKAMAADSEAEEKLARVITLFKYINDKDVFQKFYARALAKRLIHGTSVSEDAESNMISRLKTACGVEYTSRLQRMFTDMTLSAELTDKFKAFVDNASLDVGVMILTQGSWPLTGLSATEFQLPAELEKSVLHFTTYYTKNYNGRKLNWLYHLSRADLRLNFTDKRYELNVSLHQLGVLLLFNGAATQTVKEIQEGTKLSEAEIRRVCKTFLDIKLMSQIEDQDETRYKLNEKFTSKRIKIKVNAALQMDTPQENDATKKAIDEDRKLYIQASIVRVMKSRKELSHTHLMQEVIDQAKSRFQPSVAMIKKCIEQLIEKQYLDRSKGHRERYVYIS
ncbi:Cullin-2 [Rhizophlyctis rosea]|nr:Cullin-2 [Rhizophlyctis rosea]